MSGSCDHLDLRVPETLDFLSHMTSGGPYHLVAIPEVGKPRMRTFDGLGAVGAWLEQQGDTNLYFHVNQPRAGFRDGKAKEEDIVAVTWLHVDVDDLQALERIRTFLPRPTAIVFSGGGYQAFWRLTAPSHELERAKRCNVALAEKLGGDNCHNIDRIMRVPGTINWPNRLLKKAVALVG